MLEKEGGFPKNPDTIIVQPNEWYKLGLTQRDIWSYYDRHKAKLVESLAGAPVAIVTVTPKGPVVRRKAKGGRLIRIESVEDFERHNNGRNVEFMRTMGQKTDRVWVNIKPRELVPWKQSLAVAEAVREALLAFKTWNIRASYSGGGGIHVRANLPKEVDIDTARTIIQNLMEQAVVPRFANVTTDLNHHPGGVRLDVSTLRDTGTLRVPYSLNCKTGLVSGELVGGKQEKGDFTVGAFMPKSDSWYRSSADSTGLGEINQQQELERWLSSLGLPPQNIALSLPKGSTIERVKEHLNRLVSTGHFDAAFVDAYAQKYIELQQMLSDEEWLAYTNVERFGSHEKGNVGYGVISAECAGLEPVRNAERMDKLKRTLDEMGYKWEELDGSWKGIPEKSLLVKNIPEEVLADLAREYSQEAFAKSASDTGAQETPRQTPEQSPVEEAEAPAPPAPSISSPYQEPEQQPVEEQPSSESSDTSYDYKSIMGHPVFVQAMEGARPIMEERAEQFGLDPKNPESVLELYHRFHDQTKEMLSWHTLRRLDKATEPEEEEAVKKIVEPNIRTLAFIGRLYDLVSGRGLKNYNKVLVSMGEKPATIEEYLQYLEEADREQELSEQMGGAIKGLSSQNSEIIIGASGFGHDAWLGKFYPKAMKQRDRLAFYSERFAAVEITSTRHSVPPVRVFENWAAMTPDNFTFAFCAPITVRPSNPQAGAIMRSFLRRASIVGRKLGPIALHIGPLESYHTGAAAKFFDSLPPHRYAIHVESEDWQNREVLEEMKLRGYAAIDTIGGKAITDEFGWGYKRLEADKLERVKHDLPEKSLVFVKDKSDNFPSAELLKILKDMGIDMPLTNQPHIGPSDPKHGPEDSPSHSRSYEDGRGQVPTEAPAINKKPEGKTFGDDKADPHPVNQYPQHSRGDGSADPFSDNVDGRTDKI